MKLKKIHSYRFKTMANGANQVSDDTLEGWINEAIQVMVGSPKMRYYYMASGNSFIIVLRHEHKNEFDVKIVNNGYTETTYKVKRKK